MRRTTIVAALVTCFLVPVLGAAARARELHSFDRIQLTEVYFSEGASAGDIDGDGHVDAIYGPYWFAGPEFEKKHEFYAPVPQPTDRYADHFFAWVRDFDGDGDNDIFTVGFPGTPAYVYENPGPAGLGAHWAKHQVFDWVSNESPHLTDIVGDEWPELVCTRDGLFGYATIDRAKPFAPWTFHAVSEDIAPKRFGHGLGVGDVDGDGRRDIIFSGGWFEQPDDLSGDPQWTLHTAAFTNSYGGAEMYAYDVDGDGDNDIITSLAAHDFGLAWYEQTKSGDEVTFEMRLIMGSRPEDNRYGLVFSEPHSVALTDVDGDGLLDIVTGKTYWSHHKKSPMWDAGAVTYWFRLVRNGDGSVDWVPYLADEEAGIGRQVSIVDVNGDGRSDIVLGGMKGGHVLVHRMREVSEAEYDAAQPKVYVPPPKTARKDRGEPAAFDEPSGCVCHAIEGEALTVVDAGGGRTTVQEMKGFTGGRWSGGKQLFWVGAEPRARLRLEFDVARAGVYSVGAVFTAARDYGIVNLLLDDEALCEPLDLYEPNVTTTGHLGFGEKELAKGTHRLTVELLGKNDLAVPSYMVGLDCITLAPAN